MKKKSKTALPICLTVEQKEKRKKIISASALKYQASLDAVVEFFLGLGLEIVFIPEFNFKDNWRFDYYCPQLGLAVEFEGGRGHIFRNRYEGDLEKYNRAVIYGYPHLLRFVVGTLDQVKPQIYQFYRQRSKYHNGVINSVRIDELNKELEPKSEPSI